MNNLSFEDYITLVTAAMVKNNGWRLGQAFFNVLNEVRPDLSEKIRGGALDPFYRDERVDDFCNWLMNNWE